jgi:hypothetical protein
VIVHYCPKCRKKLHQEPKESYYKDIFGCALSCHDCALSLIGVDISVCAVCTKITKSTCGHKLFTQITINGKKV